MLTLKAGVILFITEFWDLIIECLYSVVLSQYLLN